MKHKTVIIIFALITAVNYNLCMEKKSDKKLKKSDRKKSADYTRMQRMLEEKIVNQKIFNIGTICYSTVEPAEQYNMLRLAIEKNKLHCLQLCLENKFNPNRYHKNLSLLHCAVQCRRPEAITILAKYNPDLVPRNDSGETPLDYAANLQYQDCIDAIGQAISKKYNKLVFSKKHCKLTKHIIKPKIPCLECINELAWQLEWHGLWKHATQKDTLQITTNLNKNVYSHESLS